MKQYHFFLLILISLISFKCKYIDFDEEQKNNLSNFQKFISEIDSTKVENIYLQNIHVLSDARKIENIYPFFYSDSIIKKSDKNPDPYAYFPYDTYDEGFTSVYYKDSLIFQNFWNYPYISQSRMMTNLMTGSHQNYKLFLIKNESEFPPNENHKNTYYRYEKIIFIEYKEKLKKIDLNYDVRGLWHLYPVKLIANKNILIFKSESFPRSYPKEICITLYSLDTGETKAFFYPSKC